jgi:hypothetical protein
MVGNKLSGGCYITLARWFAENGVDRMTWPEESRQRTRVYLILAKRQDKNRRLNEKSREEFRQRSDLFYLERNATTQHSAYGVKNDTCVSIKRLEIKQNICEAQ